jgi:hypothetical protein
VNWYLIASVLFFNAEQYANTTYTKYVFKNETECLKYTLNNYIAITENLLTNYNLEIKHVKYKCQALNQI